MEVLPVVLASGTGILTTLNAYFLKKQSSRLKMIERKSKIGIEEIRKLILEKDEVVGYIYKLYNIATELDQIISSILSLDYTPSSKMKDTNRQSTFYIYYKQDYQKWLQQYSFLYNQHQSISDVEEKIDCNSKFELEYCLHPDVNAYVYSMSLLLWWTELKKTNRTAIHAFHSGPLHIAVENISRFLHSTIDYQLRIPLIRQKGIGQQIEKYNSNQSEEIMTSEYFFNLISRWKNPLPKHKMEDKTEGIKLLRSGIPPKIKPIDDNSIINDDFIEDNQENCQLRLSSKILSQLSNLSLENNNLNSFIQNNTTILSRDLTPIVSPTSSGDLSPDYKKEIKESKTFSSIIPINIPNNYNYLVTSRKQKHELLKHYDFNKHFKHLYNNTYHLFLNIGKEQKKFKKINLDKLIITSVIKILIYKDKKFIFTNFKSIRILFFTNNINELEQKIDTTLQCKFIRYIYDKKNKSYLKKIKEFIKSCNSSCDILRIQNKIISICKPIMFEVHMYQKYSEFYDFSKMIKQLINETDKVIREDSQFREKLMS